MNVKLFSDTCDQLEQLNPPPPDDPYTDRAASVDEDAPDKFLMTYWKASHDCGTSACFGGWLATLRPDLLTVTAYGAEILVTDHPEFAQFQAISLVLEIPISMVDYVCNPEAYDTEHPTLSEVLRRARHCIRHFADQTHEDETETIDYHQ